MHVMSRIMDSQNVADIEFSDRGNSLPGFVSASVGSGYIRYG